MCGWKHTMKQQAIRTSYANIFLRQSTLSVPPAYEDNGTMVLGTAEGGMKTYIIQCK